MDNIIEMRNITKIFPGVKALSNVTFSVERGTVHALVGENGAGKSTLMKILNGVLKADDGQIFIDSQEVTFKSAIEAQEKGIGLVYQEFNLVNELSAAENIYLNRYPLKRSGTIDWKRLYDNAQAIVDKFGFSLNVKRKVGELSAAQKQLVEIAKVLSLNARLIVMDEPTSSLTNRETENLFAIINRLKKNGITIIFISHKLEEVFRISDKITILRDGQVIDTKKTGEITRDNIIEMMVGRPVSMEFPSRKSNIGEVVLEVKNLYSHNYLKDVSLTLRKGEVLGIAGLVGSGRTELAEAIFGAVKKEKGEVIVRGKNMKIRSTHEGLASSIGLVPEDRKEKGLVLDYNIVKNISITNLKKIIKYKILNRNAEKQVALKYIKDLNIRTPSYEQIVLNLSGGNQQKVVMSKWLHSGADILILDEPTRGIDVGAKYEIYQHINHLVEQGKSIIFISSELPEIMGMSDRVIVMAEGSIRGEISKKDISAELIMKLATS